MPKEAKLVRKQNSPTPIVQMIEKMHKALGAMTKLLIVKMKITNMQNTLKMPKTPRTIGKNSMPVLGINRTSEKKIAADRQPRIDQSLAFLVA